MPPLTDPLTLGQKLVAVLESGRRTATYKLAVLMALLDLAVESVPDDANDVVDINLDDLTTRVIELYWRQMRPLDGHRLRQSSDGRGVIFDAVAHLRSSVTGAHRTPSVDLVVAQGSPECIAAHATVKQALVRYPLKLLQNLTTGADNERFLYDDSWMGTGSKRVIAEHGNALTLFPGVCVTLARLAPLLKPAFQLAWVDDVRRMNRSVLDDGPDLAHHLFGADRISLQRAGDALTQEFGASCFYCDASVRAARHVDHLLPWSRVGIDGLTNLVLACAGCNSSKSDLLPAPEHVGRALARGRTVLDQLAVEINWPSQYDRVVSAGRGLYTTQPMSTPVWQGRNQIQMLTRVDFVWPG
ncbi:HNH endonuclease domain-containing protein [Gordonia sp. ABSL11-1]|uniref:HNH endonuclease n=1 Tax=Gordonia sp. ABSL11-1 TaxID=3053924 RepID=UPI002572D13C|nr:HNH endonuclease [Gordonia sp. ABSL11-1]MDL9947202.1 HNH endonuclease domain-containing protein [Gordonia sp. ABSL11-1]